LRATLVDLGLRIGFAGAEATGICLPSTLAWAPICVSGMLAPTDADAATLLPTVESSLMPRRRFASRATELRVWNCVLVEPPSDVVVAPDLCWERS
jgi:hypothetical protein